MPRFLLVSWISTLLISMLFLQAPLKIRDTAGMVHEPFELGNRKAVVLIFVGVDCPISNSYAPEINRIIADDKDSGLDFYIVYSDPKLSNDDARKHAMAFGFNCPALLDHDQLLMKQVAATVTPEVAVVGEHEAILYEGRIDNWYEDFGKQRYAATTHDLRDALKSIVAGKKVATPVTRVVGCPI